VLGYRNVAKPSPQAPSTATARCASQASPRGFGPGKRTSLVGSARRKFTALVFRSRARDRHQLELVRLGVAGVSPALCQCALPHFAGFPLCAFPREMHGGEEETAPHVHAQLVSERMRMDFRISRRAGLRKRPDAARDKSGGGGRAGLERAAPPVIHWQVSHDQPRARRAPLPQSTPGPEEDEHPGGQAPFGPSKAGAALCRASEWPPEITQGPCIEIDTPGLVRQVDHVARVGLSGCPTVVPRPGRLIRHTRSGSRDVKPRAFRA
jgi:hypothetical protein